MRRPKPAQTGFPRLSPKSAYISKIYKNCAHTLIYQKVNIEANTKLYKKEKIQFIKKLSRYPHIPKSEYTSKLYKNCPGTPILLTTEINRNQLNIHTVGLQN